MKDFAAVFDSTNARRQGQTDLSGTLQFKLLITCGNFLSANLGKHKQLTWVEETRSTEVTAAEKAKLV